MRFSAESAVIPQEKLRHYLLSRTHAEGRGKARYLAELGYEAEDWKRLETDLRAQHLIPAEEGRRSPYGLRHEIPGEVFSATDQAIAVISVPATAAREASAQDVLSARELART